MWCGAITSVTYIDRPVANKWCLLQLTTDLDSATLTCVSFRFHCAIKINLFVDLLIYFTSSHEKSMKNNFHSLCLSHSLDVLHTLRDALLMIIQ